MIEVTYNRVFPDSDLASVIIQCNSLGDVTVIRHNEIHRMKTAFPDLCFTLVSNSLIVCFDSRPPNDRYFIDSSIFSITKNQYNGKEDKHTQDAS